MLEYILASLSLFHFVAVPVTNMRELPEKSAEVVSQAYFSEEVSILENKENWVKIETLVDHYQGWVKEDELCHRENKFPHTSKKIAKVNRNMAHLYHVADTIYGPLLTLPFESVLEVLDDTNSRWIKVALVDQREGFIQRGDITFDTKPISKDLISSVCLQFLGLPYTWGGRSSFGYDCSGFVQMLYRQTGVYLPRDAKDQLKWEGFTETSETDLALGDLVFFGLDKDKIRHVGLYLGADHFIHATIAENAPYIHVSRLSDHEWNGSGRYAFRAFRTLGQAK